jgi:hypothetical protein
VNHALSVSGERLKYIYVLLVARQDAAAHEQRVQEELASLRTG